MPTAKKAPRHSTSVRQASPNRDRKETAPAAPRPLRAPYFIAAAAVIIVLFSIYAPSLHGPFLFDDNTLPFALPEFHAPLMTWLRGARPLLMLTYWVNDQISGSNTFSYHVFNLLIH